MSKFFSDKFLKAVLIHRPNRFVVRLEINGKEYGASLPNPGKLGELFIPGVTLFVIPMRPEVKYPYRVIAVESYSGEVVMLDTHTNNRIAEYLIGNDGIPSLKGYHVKRREITVGKSRFDLLLENENNELLYCEIKSCTLFGGSLAMFPDAVTSRGKRHVEELAEMSLNGIKTAVVFVIQSINIQYFMPDFHTDPDFSETLFKNRDILKIIPVLAGWNNKLELISSNTEVPILWSLYEKVGRLDRGVYLMLFHVEEYSSLSMENSEMIEIKSGYYCYIDYEESELQKKLERYKRRKKNVSLNRDILRNNSVIDSTWVIRGSSDIQDKITDSIGIISDSILSSGSSRFYYFSTNPRISRVFQEMVLDYRMRFLLRDNRV